MTIRSKTIRCKDGGCGHSIMKHGESGLGVCRVRGCPCTGFTTRRSLAAQSPAPADYDAKVVGSKVRFEGRQATITSVSPWGLVNLRFVFGEVHPYAVDKDRVELLDHNLVAVQHETTDEIMACKSPICEEGRSKIAASRADFDRIAADYRPYAEFRN